MWLHYTGVAVYQEPTTFQSICGVIQLNNGDAFMIEDDVGGRLELNGSWLSSRETAQEKVNEEG